MRRSSVPGLIVTGPVGVGKTAVSFEISEILEERAMPHALIDADLFYLYPPPRHDAQNREIGFHVLQQVWECLRGAGASRLVLPRVVDSLESLATLRQILDEVDLQVFRLSAPLPVIEGRIAKREIGSGGAWHLRRAAELLQTWENEPVEDYRIDAWGRSVREIAEDILDLSGWLPGEPPLRR